MSQSRVFLVAGKRTPFGKFGGSLALLSPTELLRSAGEALIKNLKLAPDSIDQVIVGNVLPTTADTLYSARHLSLLLGLKESTPAYSLNRLCGSGIEAIISAKRLIDLKEASAVLVGGVENMSLSPHLLYGARFGTKYGTLPTVDILLEALTDKNACISMAQTAEKLAEKTGITRKDCDDFSFHSHVKATQARQNNFLKDEIEKVKDLEHDEHVRVDATLENFYKLKPHVQKNGVVTAGTASGIVDGAVCVLIANEHYCKQYGLKPLAEIINSDVVGVDPQFMGIGPVTSIQRLLHKTEKNMSDIDLFEINEAFAGQVLACVKELQLPLEKLNVWGGAIAIGHPLGATGVRIALTLARQLKLLDKGVGIASACIGGGQGISIMLRCATL
ncbi:MAG: thiolase family protein [Bacteriovoracaceae bacterium]|nr:thiolase family protein [Bacteriovoracaceae bacterium]